MGADPKAEPQLAKARRAAQHSLNTAWRPGFFFARVARSRLTARKGMGPMSRPHSQRPQSVSPFTPEFLAQPKPYRPPQMIPEATYDALTLDERNRFDRFDDLNADFIDACQIVAADVSRLLRQRFSDAWLGRPDPRHKLVREKGARGEQRRFISAKNNVELVSGPLSIFAVGSVSFADDPYAAAVETLREMGRELSEAADAIARLGEKGGAR